MPSGRSDSPERRRRTHRRRDSSRERHRDRHHRSHSRDRHHRSRDRRQRREERRRSRSDERREEDPASAGETEDVGKPNLALSGKLAAESNKLNGVVLKYAEPAEAKLPGTRWRLYVFKNGEMTDEPIPMHRQTCFLFGRDRNVCDVPTDHPSCSKQHCVLQFRCVGVEDPIDGTLKKEVKPYLMDLESVNGTCINKQRMEPRRYYELLEQDTIRLGMSSRETIRLKATPKKETLVVDMLGGSRRYFEHNYFWDFAYMRERVRQDIEAFRKGGFELVVFSDSGFSPEVEHQWVRRRVKDVEKLLELNSALQSDHPERMRFFEAERWRPPLGVTQYLTQAFNDCGVPVYICKSVADHEGAGLCVKHSAYGVLSADTDLLLYPGIKRFFNYVTLRVDETGKAFVEGVEKSLFLRYLGITEEKLPMIIGFMGGEHFSGLSTKDKKYLEYKWKLEWLPEAVALEIKTTPADLLPPDSQRAIEHYKPIEPREWSPAELNGQESAVWATLRDKHIYRQGVAVDSLSERPCCEVLEPLRRSVYARNKLDKVTEYLCHPLHTAEQWCEGSVVESDDNAAMAPEPPEDATECAVMACDYLKFCGELDVVHHQALLMQVRNRSELLSRLKDFPKVPTIQDIHAASLFLNTVEVLYLGASVGQPRCWDVFHGPLYHYLCQNPAELESAPPIEERPSFDWTQIMAPRLVTDPQTQHM